MSMIEHALVVTPEFKVNVYMENTGPQLINRVLRDLFSLSRLTKVNKVQLVVAGPKEILGFARQLGIVTTDNFFHPRMARVYVEQGQAIPDSIAENLPDPEEVAYEVISLNTNPQLIPQVVFNDQDPYANMPLKENFKRIPETMPLTQSPPRGEGEPMWSPFL